MINAQGKFIVFEGLDGSGSTTQADLLKRWLEDKGQPVYYTKEPTEGPIGFVIRLFLSKRIGSARDNDFFQPLDETTLALAFAADRSDHLHNEIIPKLESGIIVIADRYYLSSLAYQSLTVDYDWVKLINSRFRSPDLTFFLDVPSVVCKKRMEKQRWHVELYEEVAKLELVRAQYYAGIKDLSDQNQAIEIIDGNRPIQDIHREVTQKVKALLKGTFTSTSQKQLKLGDFLKIDEKSLSLEG